MGKQRILIAVVLITLVEGMLLLAAVTLLRTAERAGETARWVVVDAPPKIALAWLLLAGAVLCAVVALAVVARLGRLRPQPFFAASFLLILTGLLLTVGRGRFYVRYAPLAGWLALASLQAAAGFWLAYRAEFRERGWLGRSVRELYRSVIMPSREVWIGAGLLLAAYFMLSATASISSSRPTMHDSGIFLYFGQQILRGDVPFRDLWDHKPPLIFYIDALGLLLTPRSLWGVWLLEFAAMGLAGLFGYAALRRVFPRWAAFAAAAAAVVHVVFFLEGGNMTEEFAMPLQMAALYLAFRAVERSSNDMRPKWSMFLNGVLFGLALSLKQTMIGVWVALAGAYLLSILFNRRAGLWRPLAWAAAGAVVTIAGWVLFFAAHGALADFWSVAYLYNFLYSDVEIGQRVWAFGDIFTFLSNSSPFFLFGIAAWAAGLLRIIWVLHRHGAAAVFGIHAAHFPLVVALLNLPVEILLIGTSGKNYRHYFLTLLPGMMLLAGWALAQLWRFSDRMVARQNLGPTLLRLSGLALLVGLLFWKPLIEINTLRSAPATEETVSTTVWYLRATTKPDDPVLMWGSHTTVNFLSNRRSPTRFVHQKPLFREGYARAEYSRELLDDLREQPPAVIVNTFLPSTPFISMSADGQCMLPEGPLPEGMEEVFAYLCEHYHLETHITKDRWEVYRRNVQ